MSHIKIGLGVCPALGLLLCRKLVIEWGWAYNLTMRNCIIIQSGSIIAVGTSEKYL